MIVSTISNKQPFGIFTIKKTNFKSDKKPDGDNINLNNHNSPLWNIKGSKNNESDVKSIEPYRFTNDENECEKHIVYHKFNINEKNKTVLNWTTNSHGNGERHKNKVINLR